MEASPFATNPFFTLSKHVKFNTKAYFRQPLSSCRSIPVVLARAYQSNTAQGRYRDVLLFSYVGNFLRNVLPLVSQSGGLACISSLPFSTGGNGGGSGLNGGGGGGGSGSGEGRAKHPFMDAEDKSAGPDVILLDVGGMSCGGCAASVKRILESQPQVSSATVNLAAETAVVWAVPDGEVMHNWQKQLGEKLASQLSTCGFKSTNRDQVYLEEVDTI